VAASGRADRAIGRAKLQSALMQNLSTLDRLLAAAQRALQTVSGQSIASRPYPPLAVTDAPPVALSESDRRHAAALIRVDHVGEVCAQALYEAQALGARQERVAGGAGTLRRREESRSPGMDPQAARWTSGTERAC